LTSQTGMFGEIVFTPCSWGPQMVPSNYGLTETCRSALFRFKAAVGHLSGQIATAS
jgi:hypothetical protein